MIVVLGRPEVQRPQPDGDLLPGGLAAEVALAVGRAGARVELVGSIGDDPEGDRVIVELGRAGVGHAALLRDPAARTPIMGHRGERRLPRLETADVDLGLRYLPECRVLVITDPLESEAREAAIAAAEYHAASVVIVAAAGSVDAESLGDTVTLLERPEPGGSESDEPEGIDSGDATDEAAFAGFIADYAVRLDRGEPAASAFGAALGDTAWEPSIEESEEDRDAVP